MSKFTFHPNLDNEGIGSILGSRENTIRVITPLRSHLNYFFV